MSGGTEENHTQHQSQYPAFSSAVQRETSRIWNNCENHFLSNYLIIS